ncbi:MAG: hypothetical protein EXR81_01075 [Gammaproteobacteria bacterium]|nr:hypothetical protein [Gammaproteobacteria bacterium]
MDTLERPTVNEQNHRKPFFAVKEILFVGTTLLAIFTGLFLITGWGYQLGWSYIFNYSPDWNSISIINLRLDGFNVFEKYKYTLGLYTCGVGLLFFLLFEALRKTKEICRSIFVVNLSKLFSSLIIFIVSVWLINIFLDYGMDYGKSRALYNMSQYNVSFKNQNNIVPFMSGGVQIYDKKDVLYNGYIINGTAENGVIYASVNVNDIPATYVIKDSLMKSPISFPTVYYDKFIACMKSKNKNFSYVIIKSDPNVKECCTLAFKDVIQC